MDGEIAPEEVKQLLQDRDGPPAGVRIVDIRSRREYASGHIPGSESIPFGSLPEEIDRFAGARRVITVCPHGAASIGAARLIASYEGLAPDATVQSMAGGLSAWPDPLDSGLDVDEEDATAPF